MANIKNFGLIGVGSDVQFGKAGPRLLVDTGVLKLKGTDGNTPFAIELGNTNVTGSFTVAAGQTVNFNNNRLTGVANGSAADDAATVGQLNVAAGLIEDLQDELDTTQASLGLSTTGTLVPFTGSIAAQTTHQGAIQFVADVAAANAEAIADQAVDIDDLQTAVAGKVSKAGDVMTGNLSFGGTGKVVNLAAPTDANDAATKSYVDNALAGLHWLPAVDKVVADHTADTTGLIVGSRVADSTDNTIYTVVSIAPVVFDSGDVLEDGQAFFDKSDETGYVFSGTELVQFTGGGQLTAGVGLTKDGNVLNVNLGAGITALPTDEVGLDLRANSGLFLTEDGTTVSTGTDAQLAIRLDGNSLVVSAAGIKVSDALTSAIADATSDIAAIESAATALAGRVTDVEADVATLQTDVDALQTDVTNLSENLIDLSDSLETRARAALSADTTAGKTGIEYNATTGVIGIDQTIIATKADLASVTIPNAAKAFALSFVAGDATKDSMVITGEVHSVKVYITTAGTGGAVTVGTVAAPTAIVPAANVDETAVGIYAVDLDYTVTGSVIRITNSAGAAGKIIVEYI